MLFTQADKTCIIEPIKKIKLFLSAKFLILFYSFEFTVYFKLSFIRITL